MGKMKGLVYTVLLCSLVWALTSSSVEAGDEDLEGHYLRGSKEMVEDKKFKKCEPPPVSYPPPYVTSPPYSPSPDYLPPYSPTPDYKSPPYSSMPDYESPPYSPKPDYKSPPDVSPPYKSAPSYTSPSPPY